MTNQHQFLTASVIAGSLLIAGCQEKSTPADTAATSTAASSIAAAPAPTPADPALFIGQPLVTDIYTADPSARVFNGKIYIYPSHDIETGITTNGEGDKFDMKDYRVLSYDPATGATTDHGEALNVKDVPWASRQLWAPDAAEKDGKFFLYFPAKNKEGI
ncbi:MAG TPA: alpha-N-arabinofuranosidase, partial [Cellvibrio sp.]